MVNEPPGQIAPLLTVMLGPEVTVTDVVAVLELIQPNVFVPVTLYVVLAVGLTTALPLEYV
jgi:hypothetical protein